MHPPLPQPGRALVRFHSLAAMWALTAAAAACAPAPQPQGASATPSTTNVDTGTQLAPPAATQPAPVPATLPAAAPATEPVTAPTTPPTTGSTTATAGGYLHTDGARIVDSGGNTVRLTGLSWFGMETSTFAPHGLWARAMGDVLDEVKSLGYNTLRIPYSNQAFDPGSAPNGIDLGKNPDLAGLDAIHILDKLIAGAKARGLRVLLDRHRPDASAQSELWYTSTVSEQRWIGDWTMLAARYKGDMTVIGFDLHNEPHGAATWGDGNVSTDWRLAAQRAGNAILAVNPDLLIVVEGIEHVGADWYWWGGNLRAARSAPVLLSVANRVVYSPHDYPSSVNPQAWFGDPAYPANLVAVWDANWGYLVKDGIAPVWIGEFGTKLQTQSDTLWLNALTSYIGANAISFSFWCLNPDSGDTGGLLQDDWINVNAAKQAALQPVLAPAF